eukprot:365810-Chlamydomonas_euryale.AAC.7
MPSSSTQSGWRPAVSGNAVVGVPSGWQLSTHTTRRSERSPGSDARAPSPCSCATGMPAAAQRPLMVSALSSTKTPTGVAPRAVATAAISAAAASDTPRLAFGHIIMPIKSAPASAAAAASVAFVTPQICRQWYGPCY